MRTLVLSAALALGLTACSDDEVSPAIDGAPADASFGETIEIPGLSAPVEVYRDGAGFLHVRCQADLDCIAAEGYFHAADRFFQMDLRRRLARGKLSEAAGALALDIDVFQRLIHANRQGKPLVEVFWEHASDETKAIFEAYTRGVNAWIADARAGEHGARTADERDHDALSGAVLEDWEPLDSVAGVLLLVDLLTDNSAREIALGQAYAALGTDAAGDIFTRRPPAKSAIVPAAQSARAPGQRPKEAQLARLEGSRSALARLRHLQRRRRELLGIRGDAAARGSNNWAVGAEMGGGAALLANDPHLSLSNPPIWYVVHLESEEGLHIAGASFASLPGVLLGQNEHIAWGATNTSADFTDVYNETLTASEDGVVFQDADVPFAERQETFEVAGQDPVERTLLYVPHHGPVIEGPNPGGATLSLRWTLHDADTDLEFLRGLWSAKSVEEAREALRSVTTAGQNFVVADRDGKIGWFPYNRYPTRPFKESFPPWIPLPGSGEAEWGPPVDYEDIPQLVDPPQGYIATANNDFTGHLEDGDPTDDGHEVIQWFVALGFRHQRIVERLEAESSHDLASMQSIQADVRSNFGAHLVPDLLEVAGGLSGLSADAQAVVSTLEGWDFQCPTGLDGTDPDAAEPASDASVLEAARGCAAFHVLLPRLREGIFGDELDQAGVSSIPPFNSTVLALTEEDPFGGRDYFDDVSTGGQKESPADVVRAALEDAGAFLADELGPDPSAWLWGRLHTVTLQADLFSSFGVSQFDSDSFVNDGGANTVDVAAPFSPSRDRYAHTAGASMRFTCEARPGAHVSCAIEIPGGQVHHRDDPFYLSLMDAWLANQPTPIPFAIEEVRPGLESFRLVSE